MPVSRGLVVLGLGSNLGDRIARLRQAVKGLAKGGVWVDRISSVYESPPLGYLAQPPFLNAVLVGQSSLAPEGILHLARELEKEAGRERTFPNAPRTLDVDLIFYGNRIVRHAGVAVPHPRWRGRSFVVKPLWEILPVFRDPESGWRVEEVARLWPLEPGGISIVEGPEALRTDLNKGCP